MLSESFVASLLTSNATQTTSSVLKDAGVCIHEFRPNSSLRATLKKSSTDSNCLAVSASHIFAVQAGKAVVNVYNRERGNQEATLPFPERIRSIAIAGGDDGGGIIVLGTEGGKLILWEVCTGRQIFTPAAHLQPITSLVVDPTNNFILSGSKDSTIHVWSLPGLISFSKPPTDQSAPLDTPIRTISNHSTAVTSIAVGHSINRSNFAVSTSEDGTAIIWEYRTGKILHTYLLPASPQCLTVDPADRAVYVGYSDGSIQLIDFFAVPTVQNPLYETSQQATPTQLTADSRWLPPSSELGPTLCLTLSYDGTSLISGHKSGAVASWDIGRGRYASAITDFKSPVTNLQMLHPSGLPGRKKRMTIHSIVKPRFDHALSAGSTTGDSVPAMYNFSTQLNPSTPDQQQEPLDDFTTALTHSYFPSSLISEGLLELSSLNNDSGQQSTLSTRPESDKTSLTNNHENENNTDTNSRIKSLEQEIQSLKKQASVQERTRQANTGTIVTLQERIAELEDVGSELVSKQEAAEQRRNEKRMKKEEQGSIRRKKWFEAEQKEGNGDAVLERMDLDGDDQVSSDDASSEG